MKAEGQKKIEIYLVTLNEEFRKIIKEVKNLKIRWKKGPLPLLRLTQVSKIFNLFLI